MEIFGTAMPVVEEVPSLTSGQNGGRNTARKEISSPPSETLQKHYSANLKPLYNMHCYWGCFLCHFCPNIPATNATTISGNGPTKNNMRILENPLLITSLKKV